MRTPYRYLQVRGKVIEETEEGAYEMFCRLNDKYQGNSAFPLRPGKVGVTYNIFLEHVRGA